MGFTRWLLRPRDKQVPWRADICLGPYVHSVVISVGGGVGCQVFQGIGYWSPPLLEWIPSPRKLWNEEQIGVQWEAPGIPKRCLRPLSALLLPSYCPPGVWDFHLSGVGWGNRSLPVNILRCSVTPLTSVLSVQVSFSCCIQYDYTCHFKYAKKTYWICSKLMRYICRKWEAQNTLVSK